jgi:hypothetical protein
MRKGGLAVKKVFLMVVAALAFLFAAVEVPQAIAANTDKPGFADDGGKGKKRWHRRWGHRRHHHRHIKKPADASSAAPDLTQAATAPRREALETCRDAFCKDGWHR